VPTVAYDSPAADLLVTTGAGRIVAGPDAFVDAVVTLATDEAARSALAAPARAHAPSLSWDHLAARYGDLLDRHLPAGGS
jgi:glycosyltransferase involved in cell wall biosynthesis